MTGGPYPYIASLAATLMQKGMVGFGLVGKDGQVILREGVIASWMPEPGHSIAECQLLSSFRDDIAAMDETSEPLIIPDFAFAGLAALGKLTIILTMAPDLPQTVMILVSQSRKDNTQAQIARAKVREQDMIEERMLAATREIERMNRQLEQFASVAAHDLQAPLRQIGTLLAFLKQEASLGLSPQAQVLIVNMEDALQRMRAQIDGLYEYSRTSSQPLLKTDFNLAEAIDDALSNLASDVTQSGAEVVRGRLPVFHGAKSLFTSVFQNLISNAIKYRSHTTPVITITAEERPDRLMIAITDNGTGIAPEHSESIFKLFARNPLRSDVGGIGIGLALCRQIVARHGGTLRHDATYGDGARMVMELPKAREAR